MEKRTLYVMDGTVLQGYIQHAVILIFFIGRTAFSGRCYYTSIELVRLIVTHGSHSLVILNVRMLC
jgi:hypothetical protein